MILALWLLAAGAGFQARAGYSPLGAGQTWGADDAYISYRYARHYFHGDGLVYNRGEVVEGYSNLLYVMLIAFAFFFTEGLGIYFVSVYLNLVFAALALSLFYVHVRRRAGRRHAVGAALLMALNLMLWQAIASGLGTTLLLVFQMAVWLAVERVVEKGGWRSGLALAAASALCILARADGFIFPALAVGYLLLKGRLRPALLLGAAAASTLGVYVAWRLHYYGYPLPNTYYAKVTGTLQARAKAALEVLVEQSGQKGYRPYLMIVAAAVARLVRRPRQALRFDHLAGAGAIAYWLYVGGDHLGERFLLPAFFAAAALLMAWLARSLKRPAVALAVLMLAGWQAVFAFDARFVYTPPAEKYDSWVTLGRYLGEHHPGKTLAASAIGKIGFFSGLTTIDMHGLTDAYIGHLPASYAFAGHDKGDIGYVLARNPDLIAAWVGTNLSLSNSLERDLYTDFGYTLRYVLNTRLASAGEDNIIDVRGMDDGATADIIRSGYRYGVLERGIISP